MLTEEKDRIVTLDYCVLYKYSYLLQTRRGTHCKWFAQQCNYPAWSRPSFPIDSIWAIVIAWTLHTRTHNCLTALFPRLPGWSGTRKVKLIWILLKQETVSGSGISWAICKSAPRSSQIITPATHHSVFLQAGCPSCCPTNSVKALKVLMGGILLELLCAMLRYVVWHMCSRLSSVDSPLTIRISLCRSILA